MEESAKDNETIYTTKYVTKTILRPALITISTVVEFLPEEFRKYWLCYYFQCKKKVQI